MLPSDELDGRETDAFARSASDLDVVLARRTPRRVRVAQAGGVALAIIVVTLAIWRPIIPVGKTAVGPTATALPLTAIMIQTNAPNGDITVDGKPTAFPAFSLKFGKHTLKYVASPFLPITCTLSFPVDAKDTCRDPDGQLLTQDVSRTINVYFIFTPEMLPTDLADRAAATLSQEITALSTSQSTSVTVGEHYGSVSPTFHVAVAEQPLTAQITMALGPPRGNCWLGHYCWSGLSANAWLINVALDEQIDYLSDAGQRIDFYHLDGAEQHSLQIQFDAQTATWSVTDLNGRDSAEHACFPPRPFTDYGFDTSLVPKDANGDSTGYGLNFSKSSFAGVEGCFATIELTSTFNAQQPFAQGTYLYRFGALLVMDDGAHRMFPSAPYANADEIAAVQNHIAP